MTPKIECVSCHHSIDAEARLCPYCGADPRTGERFDPKPLMDKHFPKKAELTRSEAALEFFRERQGIIGTVVVAGIFLALVGLHRFITARNARQVSDVPAIPLTEVADLSHRSAQNDQEPIPQIDFQYAGSAQSVRTLLVEPGAVAPPTPPDLNEANPVLSRFIAPKPRPAPPPTTTAPPGDPTATAMPTTTTDTASPQPATETPPPSAPVPPPTSTETSGGEGQP
jgi:hypothetical protein